MDIYEILIPHVDMLERLSLKFKVKNFGQRILLNISGNLEDQDVQDQTWNLKLLPIYIYMIF